ncbi:MAG: DUF1800 family protein, partial [bacterium]
MAISRRQILTGTALAGAGAAIALTRPGGSFGSLVSAVLAEPGATVATPPAEIIALTRAGYGPSPESLARVTAIGLAAYLAEQLTAPSTDDPAVTALLAQAEFPMRLPAPEPGEEPMMQESMTDESMAMQEQAAPRRRGGKKNRYFPNAAEPQPQTKAELKGKPNLVPQMLPLQYLGASQEELWELTKGERGTEKNVMARRPGVEVTVASWIRQTYSPWQLQEVLTEFWHNHFNIDLESDKRISPVLPLYDRTIRQHALGNFREMLEAVATSPAMLYYLNNASSKASPANENYAREMFEL